MDPWVQDRSARPVDATTPRLGTFVFEDIAVVGARWCAAWVAGLPEEPVEGVVFRRVSVDFAKDPDPGEPAMAGGVAPVARGGFLISGADELAFDDVDLSGVEGAPVVLDGVPLDGIPE